MNDTAPLIDTGEERTNKRHKAARIICPEGQPEYNERRHRAFFLQNYVSCKFSAGHAGMRLWSQLGDYMQCIVYSLVGICSATL